MQELPRKILDPVLARLDQAFGSGYSAVVYGSVARDEFVEGVSDINLLLVCEQLDSERLARLGSSLVDLRQQGQPPPLLFEREEWARAADVFPVEMADMLTAHLAVRGPDPLASVRVDPGDLRRVLEQELRGKLLRLRQAYAVQRTEPQLLQAMVVRSVSSIAALFRALLVLAGSEPIRETPRALQAAGRVMGRDLGPVLELWEKHRTNDASCPPELLERYLAAISAAIRFVDQFIGGN
jgi:predicted nucleotidyltransferase